MIVLFICSDVFFFKQKTAYEMRISDWSSDVCSSDLRSAEHAAADRTALDRGHRPGTDDRVRHGDFPDRTAAVVDDARGLWPSPAQSVQPVPAAQIRGCQIGRAHV